MTPHSSTLAWKIPWKEDPGRLQSIGSLRATSPSLFTFMHWRRKWQPTPVFLPGESRGQRSLVAPKELCSSFLRSLTSSELQDCGHCLEATRIKKLPLPQNRITLYHLQSEPAKWTHHPCFLTFTKLMTEQRHLW